MRWYIFIFVLVFSACASAPVDRESIEGEIRSALENQVSSWNEGKLEGYMKYYLDSPELTFHSGKEKLTGWDRLDSMYREKYSGDQRGILEFMETRIGVLSGESAYVTGRWSVQLQDTLKYGRFTLIMKKIEGEWRIVHDHSS